jgi:hypothetical protein
VDPKKASKKADTAAISAANSNLDASENVEHWGLKELQDFADKSNSLELTKG